jgi:type IV pilus assembly protein PilM
MRSALPAANKIDRSRVGTDAHPWRHAMPANTAVWGIEIGHAALKAVKLRHADNGMVELVAFDLIEHPKILSQPDANPEELIRAALEKFASRNEWKGDQIVIGVPGQQTFSRFTKLPPVDEKKIPDIVRFEAGQQIPFDMDDVVWDYEVFRAPESPDVEVGIFAMRKDLVRKQIEYFNAHGLQPSVIQTVPSALYNFYAFDAERKEGEKGATILVDVGAAKTDLIVVEQHSSWSRNIPLGGNNFTEALVRAFKLSPAKAESLKRGAAASKHARQVFQAMRPVFAELVAEIQRSIGFYSSTHRDVELTHVVACGSAFRLPGLQKYLENNLTIEGGVQKLEKFNKLVPTETSNAPVFTDNVVTFGPAYGLALQGLGHAKITANLLPPDLARVAMWRRKQPYFIASAATLLVAAMLPWSRNWMDQQALASGEDQSRQATTIVNTAKSLDQKFREAQTDTGAKKTNIDKIFELQKNKDLVPRILALVHEATPRVPEFERATSPDEIKKLIEANPQRLARASRKQITIDSIDIQYSKNIDAEERAQNAPAMGSGFDSGAGSRFGAGGSDVVGDGGGRFGSGGDLASSGDSGGAAEAPGFIVSVSGRSTFGGGQGVATALQLFTSEYYANLRQLGRRPGQGFYVPEIDEKSLDNKMNLQTPSLTQFIPPQAARGNQPYASPGGFRGAGDTVGGGDVVGGSDIAVGGSGASERDPKVDPLTGEDMSNDWRFTFSFKIKLGEMPPEAPKEPAQ